MGKLMDPEEAAATAPGQANATGGGRGGEHIVILDDGEGGPAPKRLKGKPMLRGEEEPVRTEGGLSGGDAWSPQETMEAVLLKLPESEKEAMGIDALYAVRVVVVFGLFLSSRNPTISTARVLSSFTHQHTQQPQAKAALVASGEYWPRVEALWGERQALLQRAYDEMLKPAEMLQKLIGTLAEAAPDVGLEGGLRQALVDLEDQLSDVDMARDFYTLGGLRPLVALLDRGHARCVRVRVSKCACTAGSVWRLNLIHCLDVDMTCIHTLLYTPTPSTARPAGARRGRWGTR